MKIISFHIFYILYANNFYTFEIDIIINFTLVSNDRR